MPKADCIIEFLNIYINNMTLIYLVNGFFFSMSFLARCFWAPSFPVQTLAAQNIIAERQVSVPLQPIRNPVANFYDQWEEELNKSIRIITPFGDNINDVPLGQEALHNTLGLFRQRLIGDPDQIIPQISHVQPEYVNWQGLEELSFYFLLREGFVQPQDLTDCPITTHIFAQWLDLGAIWGPMIPNIANVPNQPLEPPQFTEAQLEQLPGDVNDWCSELLSIGNVQRIPDAIQNRIGNAIRLRYYKQIFQTPKAKVYIGVIVVHNLSVCIFVVLFLWF